MKFQGRRDNADAMRKRNAKIRELADAGYEHRDIARRFGVARQTIEHILKQERQKDENK